MDTLTSWNTIAGIGYGTKSGLFNYLDYIRKSLIRTNVFVLLLVMPCQLMLAMSADVGHHAFDSLSDLSLFEELLFPSANSLASLCTLLKSMRRYFLQIFYLECDSGKLLFIICY